MKRLALAAALFAAGGAARAASVPDAWSHGQTLTPSRPGLAVWTVPFETLDRALPDLHDLRLFSPDGAELAFTEEEIPRPRPSGYVDVAVEVALEADRTVVSGHRKSVVPVEALRLDAAGESFLKSVTLEAWRGGRWTAVVKNRPIHRQRFVGEDLEIAFPPQRIERFRAIVDDAKSPPVVVGGAAFREAPRALAGLEDVPLRLDSTATGPVETRLRVVLPARNLYVEELVLEIEDPYFQRPARALLQRVAERGGPESAVVEELLGAGALCRWPDEDGGRFERLTVFVGRRLASREIEIAIANGDSPPLRVRSVKARAVPTRILFSAVAAEPHVLAVGRADAPLRRYDLSLFKNRLKNAPRVPVEAGPLEANPNHRPPEVAPELAASGAPLDESLWPRSAPVRIDRDGVQRLEITAEVLAAAQPDGRDLRLVRGGRQVPFVYDFRPVPREVGAAARPAADALASTSRWEIPLPVAGLPVTHVEVDAAEKLFSRVVTVEEERSAPGGGPARVFLGRAVWSRRGPESRLLVPLDVRPRSGRIYLNVDDGDNAPLTLDRFRLHYATYGLVFKARSGEDVALRFGNAQTGYPQYDAALVAGELLAADKNVAALGDAGRGRRGWRWSGSGGGPILWAGLALATAALLWALTRLLPPPTAKNEKK